MQDSELLTVREVARRCRRSEETVRRWIWSGKLVSQKLGNQHFVRLEDVHTSQTGQAGGRRLDLPPIPVVRIDKAKHFELIERARKLRKKIFKAHGYFDVAEAVREARKGLH